MIAIVLRVKIRTIPGCRAAGRPSCSRGIRRARRDSRYDRNNGYGNNGSYERNRSYGNNGSYERNRGYGNNGGYNNSNQIGMNQGYQAGINTGASDAQRGQSYSPQRSHYYKDASSQAFRNGFVQGYDVAASVASWAESLGDLEAATSTITF